VAAVVAVRLLQAAGVVEGEVGSIRRFLWPWSVPSSGPLS